MKTNNEVTIIVVNYNLGFYKFKQQWYIFDHGWISQVEEINGMIVNGQRNKEVDNGSKLSVEITALHRHYAAKVLA